MEEISGKGYKEDSVTKAIISSQAKKQFFKKNPIFSLTLFSLN
jgi:hypothetical protein